MEQAVNLFNQGLLQDLNPMMLGANSLSDCLNGTLITMNGNEVILQNDMGNRKIDHAYLPNGYEPVGMKEYGGVIYVAAYNPITHKSQIGSFPSPERRINSETFGNRKLDFEFDLYEESSLNNLLCLKEDTILLPLTDDTSLHAGDKFIVYFQDLQDDDRELLLNEITNYNNYDSDTKKVITPKNKKYTLSLGVLNSQNEFVDITSSLVRWDSNGKIIDTLNLTELQKFNIGYFIRDLQGYNFEGRVTGESCELTECSVSGEVLEANTLEETIKDEKLTKERELALNVYDANTYAYKLIGPLYLQAKLNHILNFSYNLYGAKEDNKIKLTIIANVTYNCPDQIFSEQDGGDENYKKYDLLNINISEEVLELLGTIEKEKLETSGTYNRGIFTPQLGISNIESFFDFIIENNVINEQSISYANHTYNPITGLYNIQVTKEYSFDKPRGNQLEYVIGVKSGHKIKEDSNEKDIYLSELSTKDILEIDKLGTGKIKLTGWKFYNDFDNKKGTISYSFKAYPRYNEEFNNLRFEFYETEYKNQQLVIKSEPLGEMYIADMFSNGRGVVDFNWENCLKKYNNKNNFQTVSLEPQTTYIVKIKYDDYYEGKVGKNKDLNHNEFYLTTELFNDCYSSKTTNDKFVVDYGYPNTIPITNIWTIENPDKEIKILRDLLTIKYNIIDTTDHNKFKPKVDEDSDKFYYSSKLVSDKENDILIEYSMKQKLFIILNSDIEYNELIYPKTISKNPDLKFKYDNGTYKLSSNITYQQNNGYNDDDRLNDNILVPDNEEERKFELKENGQIDLSFVNKNIYISKGIQNYDIYFKNGYCLASDKDSIQDILNITKNNLSGKRYGAVTMSGSYSDNFISLRTTTTESIRLAGYDTHLGGDDTYNKTVGRRNVDDGYFYVGNYYDQIKQNFNEVNSNVVFLYNYNLDDLEWYNIGQNNPNPADPKEKNSNDTTRIWWRNLDNDMWVLFRGVCNIDKEAEFISKCLSDASIRLNDYYYSHYKEILNTEGYYVPSKSYKYNNEYDLSAQISYKVSPLKDLFNMDKIEYLPFLYDNDSPFRELSYKVVFDTRYECFQDLYSQYIIDISELNNIIIKKNPSVESDDKFGFQLSSSNGIYKASNLEQIKNSPFGVFDKFSDKYRAIVNKDYSISSDDSDTYWDVFEWDKDGDAGIIVRANFNNIPMPRYIEKSKTSEQEESGPNPNGGFPSGGGGGRYK